MIKLIIVFLVLINGNDTGKFIMITLKERLEKYNITKLQKIIPVIGFSKNKIININNL